MEGDTCPFCMKEAAHKYTTKNHDISVHMQETKHKDAMKRHDGCVHMKGAQ